MDDAWEHTPNETINVTMESKERVKNFGDFPYVIQQELRKLSYPPDPNSVSASAFDNMHRWQRSDGVTTFIADEHGDKDIYFCDYKNDGKGGAALAHAAIQSTSLVKIFVRPQHRHHYEAAHLLITIDEFLKERDKHLDSGTLAALSKKEGWLPPDTHKLARAVWSKLVDAGFAEPAPQQNGAGVPDRFRFIAQKTA